MTNKELFELAKEKNVVDQYLRLVDVGASRGEIEDILKRTVFVEQDGLGDMTIYDGR